MSYFPFLEAIKRGTNKPGSVIAELKCQSAYGDDLFAGRAVSQILDQYHAGGATALSVVTGSWFGGTRDLLVETVAKAKGLPVLRKDFLCSPRAIQETADLGASAVLVTCKLVPEKRLPALLEMALTRGVTPFVEIANDKELAHIPDDLPIILAVNNADIETKERTGAGTKRSHALYAAARAKRPGAVVSASQISDAATARSIFLQGFDAVLMGTALLRQPSLLQQITSNPLKSGTKLKKATA